MAVSTFAWALARSRADGVLEKALRAARRGRAESELATVLCMVTLSCRIRKRGGRGYGIEECRRRRAWAEVCASRASSDARLRTPISNAPSPRIRTPGRPACPQSESLVCCTNASARTRLIGRLLALLQSRVLARLDPSDRQRPLAHASRHQAQGPGARGRLWTWSLGARDPCLEGACDRWLARAPAGPDGADRLPSPLVRYVRPSPVLGTLSCSREPSTRFLRFRKRYPRPTTSSPRRSPSCSTRCARCSGTMRPSSRPTLGSTTARSRSTCSPRAREAGSGTSEDGVLMARW